MLEHIRIRLAVTQERKCVMSRAGLALGDSRDISSHACGRREGGWNEQKGRREGSGSTGGVKRELLPLRCCFLRDREAGGA